MSRKTFAGWAGTVAMLAALSGVAAKHAPAQEANQQPALNFPRVDLVALQQQQPGEHPLAPALRIAHEGLKHIDRDIQDYSCTLVKREQIDGVVGDYEYIFLKVRHRPYSVYMYFLGPADIKGREVIYVDGQNNGKMLAHEAQGLKARIGMVALDPNGMFAKKGQRHAITETGIRNLTARLIEVAERDSKFGECDVKFFNGAKINGRVCTCIQVTHPVPRRQFEFHLARVFIDDELQVPIRYEAYEWPKTQGGQPVLVEEYTHLNMKVNNRFTDFDFDHRNPNYGFIRK